VFNLEPPAQILYFIGGLPFWPRGLTPPNPNPSTNPARLVPHIAHVTSAGPLCPNLRLASPEYVMHSSIIKKMKVSSNRANTDNTRNSLLQGKHSTCNKTNARNHHTATQKTNGRVSVSYSI